MSAVGGLFLSCVLASAPLALAAVEPKVSCEKPGPWTISLAKTASGEIEEFEIVLRSPTEAVPPRFEVTFDVPQLDAHHKWTTQMEKVTMPPNWAGPTVSRLCASMPLVAFLNDSDRNRICVAASDPLRTVTCAAGLREEDCRIEWTLTFFSEAEAPIAGYSVRIRIDRRDVYFGDAIREGTDWIVRSAGLRPTAPPAAAFEPLYSSWYAFHKNVGAADIEAECAEAAKLGMKVLIVDDGWQTDDNGRDFAYTGDWEVSKRRFPDMAAHVRKVHALGMKYMVWCGVPMMGLKARNYGRFKDKCLWTQRDRWSNYSCLDPRFPEVREHIITQCEKALRDWDLDGLKLDFIDAIAVRGTDPAIRENYAGRDLKALPLAVDRLMGELLARLKAIKPDVLIEFRQGYIGPAIRQYGNMLRASDCPGDLLANRARTANLRLTSGDSAVHSDMLEWHRDETAETAARYVLSTIFSTIQYSVMLRTCSEPHGRMIAHWLKFAKDHRNALLHGEFRPHHYEAFYPWIEAEDRAERIAAVYVVGTVVPADAAAKPNYVLNGTGEGEIVVDSATAATAKVFDTFGAERGAVALTKGLNRVALPVSGYIRIEREDR